MLNYENENKDLYNYGELNTCLIMDIIKLILKLKIKHYKNEKNEYIKIILLNITENVI